MALLLHAADASEDGTRKLDQAWRVGREAEGTGERGIRLPLDRAALSVALGRDNVVHLALADRDEAGLLEVAAEIGKAHKRKVTTHRVDVGVPAEIQDFANAAIATIVTTQ